MHVCMCIHILCVYIYIFCVCVCIYIYSMLCVHTYIHIYIHTYAHTYTWKDGKHPALTRQDTIQYNKHTGTERIASTFRKGSRSAGKRKGRFRRSFDRTGSAHRRIAGVNARLVHVYDCHQSTLRRAREISVVLWYWGRYVIGWHWGRYVIGWHWGRHFETHERNLSAL